jgi:ribonuclease HI
MATPAVTTYVFTDGATRGNGKVGARGSYAVYWGPYAKLNECGLLPGALQTNQRAELYAVLRAFQQIAQLPLTNKYVLVTDSMYTINCLTKWASNWVKNGWIASDRQPVKNQDLIVPLYDVYCKQGHRVRLQHVNGHSKSTDFLHQGNNVADKMCNDVLDAPPQ